MGDLPQHIGDYQVEALLGEGGMAKVYRARHTVLDTLHAIKVLNPELRVNPDARRRFLDEARIQAKHLDHPNIVKVTTIVASADHAALVMELIEGGSLESRLPELGRRPERIVPIMLGILDGMAHAHAAGVVHRDLKPTNVLLAVAGDRLIPKVTDFGIAKVSAELAGKGKKSTQGSARMGTLGYMAPEQIRGAKQATTRSDIFALGAILYELATGAPPFSGDSDYDVMDQIVNGRYQPPERTYAGISPAIAAVIRKALATDPAERYSTCEEMAAALRAALERPAGAAASAPAPTTTATRPAPPPSSLPAAVATAASARPGDRSTKPWLIAGLVAAGAALGGTSVYLAVTANSAPKTPVADRGGGAVPALDAADAGAAIPSAAVEEIDAGPELAALAPEVPTTTPPDLAIDAGVDEELPPLLVIDGTPASPLADHPCVGSWRGTAGGGRIVIKPVDGEDAVCGTLKYNACAGSLRKCTWSEGAMRARYRCTASGFKSTGTMKFTCAGTRMTNVDTDDTRGVNTEVFKKR